jgi:hypothetical protein
MAHYVHRVPVVFSWSKDRLICQLPDHDRFLRNAGVHTLKDDTQEPDASAEAPVADDLMLHAGPISKFLLGRDDRRARKRVYNLAAKRSPDRPPLFRIGGVLAARKSRLREWIVEEEVRQLAQYAAENQAFQEKKPPPRRRGRPPKVRSPVETAPPPESIP